MQAGEDIQERAHRRYGGVSRRNVREAEMVQGYRGTVKE